MNPDCLDQIRIMYQLYTGADIADAIKIVRAEMTAEEDRHALQVEILQRQKKLEEMR
jgi:pilus assembly protein TadC